MLLLKEPFFFVDNEAKIIKNESYLSIVCSKFIFKDPFFANMCKFGNSLIAEIVMQQIGGMLSKNGLDNNYIGVTSATYNFLADIRNYKANDDLSFVINVEDVSYMGIYETFVLNIKINDQDFVNANFTLMPLIKDEDKKYEQKNINLNYIDKYAEFPNLDNEINSLLANAKLIENEVQSYVYLDGNISIFSGHFVGFPIFPGTMQLFLSQKLIEFFLRHSGYLDKSIFIKKSVVKFLNKITPNVFIYFDLKATKLSDNDWQFKIKIKDEQQNLYSIITIII
jgi:3-hydroxymyristoyl/3-hydroxydecanoyl-(acyl carrier protein) dehydratase